MALSLYSLVNSDEKFKRNISFLANTHCLHTPEEIDEAIADPKAHWEQFGRQEDEGAGLETRHQGQSTLDECMPEYGRGSGEKNVAW